MTFRVEPLGTQDLDRFTCGNEELDRWLRSHARTATGQGTRTHLLLAPDGSVAGYFSLAPHLLEREHAPLRLGRGAPRQIPGVLLAKLAVAGQFQGQGLGSELLAHALVLTVRVARQAGGRIVLVDAIDASADAFYRHHNFQLLPGNDQRLVLKLSTAAAALGLDWP